MTNQMHISCSNIDPKEINKNLLYKLARIIRERNLERHIPLPVNSIDYMMKDLVLPDKPTYRIIWFIAQDNKGAILGYATLGINTGLDNLDRSSFHVYVQPEYRNQGIAKRILETLIEYIPDNITVMSTSIRKYKSAEASNPLFKLREHLEKNGGKNVLSDRSSASLIKEFNPDDVLEEANKLKITANDKGYDIYYVENVKFAEVPEIDFSSYIKMVERIWNDMPREDGSWEDTVMTEEHYLSYFNDLDELGRTIWTFVAVHRETGKPIALSETALENDIPELSQQWDTGVLSEHRGNRLGLTLKYQILSKLLNDERSKSVEYWVTENAHSNEHMLNINDILGYKELSTFEIFEFNRKEFENNLK